jgi:potassium/hydrogen antiporter
MLIIFATYPILANLPQAELILNVAVFTITTSVLVQGTPIPLVAKLLGIDAPLAAEPGCLAKCDLGGVIKDRLMEVMVPQGSPAACKQIVNLGLNRDLMMVVLRSETDLPMSSGKIALQPGGVLLVRSNEASLNGLESDLGIKTEIG